MWFSSIHAKWCSFFGHNACYDVVTNKKEVNLMKKNTLKNNAPLMLVLAILFFPIGVILALTKRYQ